MEIMYTLTPRNKQGRWIKYKSPSYTSSYPSYTSSYNDDFLKGCVIGAGIGVGIAALIVLICQSKKTSKSLYTPNRETYNRNPFL